MKNPRCAPLQRGGTTEPQVGISYLCLRFLLDNSRLQLLRMRFFVSNRGTIQTDCSKTVRELPAACQSFRQSLLSSLLNSSVAAFSSSSCCGFPNSCSIKPLLCLKAALFHQAPKVRRSALVKSGKALRRLLRARNGSLVHTAARTEALLVGNNLTKEAMISG